MTSVVSTGSNSEPASAKKPGSRHHPYDMPRYGSAEGTPSSTVERHPTFGERVASPPNTDNVTPPYRSGSAGYRPGGRMAGANGQGYTDFTGLAAGPQLNGKQRQETDLDGMAADGEYGGYGWGQAYYGQPRHGDRHAYGGVGPYSYSGSRMTREIPEAVDDVQSRPHPNDGSKTKVCRHFVRGRCTWGDDCRFSHDLSSAVFEGPESSVFATNEADSGTGEAPWNATRFSPSAVAMQVADEHQRYLGHQQQLLQAQRHAVLEAALQAKFQIRAIANRSQQSAEKDSTSGDGQTSLSPGSNGHCHQRGQVILTSIANAPDIIISILEPEDLRRQLDELANHPRVNAGGLHYLLGEASVFWSMVRLWHVSGTTGDAAWDGELDRAQRDGSCAVHCMFHRMLAGCLAPRCPFRHEGPSGTGDISAAA
jgi:hypothetical protein